MGILAVQLIDASSVGDLQDYLAVLKELSFDHPGHPLKITASGTIEVSAAIDEVDLSSTDGE